MTHSWNAFAVSCHKTITLSIIVTAYSIFSLQLRSSVIQIILESLSRYKSSQNLRSKRTQCFKGTAGTNIFNCYTDPFPLLKQEGGERKCSGMGSLIQTTLSRPGSVLPEDNRPPVVSLSIPARVFTLIPKADLPWNKVCGSAC